MNMQDFNITQTITRPTPEGEAEFSLLMSLALDNLLNQEEDRRFQYYLQSFPVCNREWRTWQQVHRRLQSAPTAEPPVDFVQKFEARLIQQERRRQLWQGALIGGLVLVLWGGLFFTIAGLSVYLLVNQAAWSGELIHRLVYSASAINQWGGTLRRALETFMGTPQAAGVGIGYLAVAIVLLSWWIRFLQRTTHAQESIPAEGALAL
jgi:anti-sigma factor RsiW